MHATDVVPARASDSDRAIASLVAAFVADPFIRWMFPDAKRYLDYFPEVLTHFAGGAFAHDSAHRTADFRGAGLWLPPGVEPDEEALGAVVQERCDEGHVDEVFAVLEQVGAGHPDEAHWYLPAIGVEPIAQGRAAGTRAGGRRPRPRRGLPRGDESPQHPPVPALRFRGRRADTGREFAGDHADVPGGAVTTGTDPDSRSRYGASRDGHRSAGLKVLSLAGLLLLLAACTGGLGFNEVRNVEESELLGQPIDAVLGRLGKPHAYYATPDGRRQVLAYDTLVYTGKMTPAGCLLLMGLAGGGGGDCPEGGNPLRQCVALRFDADARLVEVDRPYILYGSCIDESDDRFLPATRRPLDELPK